MHRSGRFALFAAVGVTMFASAASATGGDDYLVLPGPSGLLPNLPDAVVDLRTRTGAELVDAH